MGKPSTSILLVSHPQPAIGYLHRSAWPTGKRKNCELLNLALIYSRLRYPGRRSCLALPLGYVRSTRWASYTAISQSAATFFRARLFFVEQSPTS